MIKVVEVAALVILVVVAVVVVVVVGKVLVFMMNVRALGLDWTLSLDWALSLYWTIPLILYLRYAWTHQKIQIKSFFNFLSREEKLDISHFCSGSFAKPGLSWELTGAGVDLDIKELFAKISFYWTIPK